MSAQRRAVADKPQMTEWIDESTLPVYSPRHLVVTDLVDGAVCSGRNRPLNESAGVIDKDFDPHRSAAKRRRCIPTVVLRLTEKEWCALDRQSDYAAKVPQLGCAYCLGVPASGCRCIGNSEHHRDEWTGRLGRHHLCISGFGTAGRAWFVTPRSRMPTDPMNWFGGQCQSYLDRASRISAALGRCSGAGTS
jgi:hypothetical protein